MATRVVLDTNVLVAALRSRNGASFRILRSVGTGQFEHVVTVPIVLEYEYAAKRSARSMGLRHADIGSILDFVCRAGDRREVFFLWRPFLRDPKDDMFLEAAVEGGCDFIVTHNIKDYAGIDQFGLAAIRPGAFLRSLKGAS